MSDKGFEVGNMLLHHLDRVVNSQKPITAEIFLTDYCNHDCLYCERKGNKGRMEFGDFVNVVRRLKELGVKGFILTGGGEPLIHPEINGIVDWLNWHGIRYGINSNFSNYVEGLKPVFLKVSVDGYDNNDYMKKRGVREGEYERLFENLKRFRKENKVSEFGVQAVIFEPDEVMKFYRSVFELDVDYIVFRPLESVGRVYSNDKYEKIMSEMEYLKSVDKRVVMNYKWKVLFERVEKCFSNWSVITVDSLGNVPYCCQRLSDVVGNVFDDDILEKKKWYKADMLACEVPCRLSGNNLFLRGIMRSEGCEFV
jgi:MoaA/NifB/PqqE/SkfB family radical SAM enzyme